MDSDRIERLKLAIEALTAAMRTAADDGDWSEVARAEAERRPLLRTLLEGDYPEQESESARDWIQWLQAQDAVVLEKGNHVRDQFLNELHYGAEADRAIRAYQRTGRGRE